MTPALETYIEQFVDRLALQHINVPETKRMFKEVAEDALRHGMTEEQVFAQMQKDQGRSFKAILN